MDQNRQPRETAAPGIAGIVLWAVVAAGAFHVAYASVNTSFLIVVYLFALLQLAGADTWRNAFYPGLAVGLTIAVLHLTFFWRIFSAAALALWLVYAFWIGLFVALARLCSHRLGPARGLVLMPFLWTGLEYFRSELYYLRFSWLNVGYAFAAATWQVPFRDAGVYGVGFLLMTVAAVGHWLWRSSRIPALAALFLGVLGVCAWGFVSAAKVGPPPTATVRIAGVQMEFPNEAAVLARLTDLVEKHPETELVVLSEYTFGEPVPEPVKAWCRTNQRYLIVGGKDPAPGTHFYNTAFVVGPTGDLVFRQAKRVPIQFFDDGLPASEQKLWNSPWGKIGLCICYDLGYRRVTDELVRQGAQAIICPTMDVEAWGRGQHALHARVAPVRAAEYGVPVFRVASSGISQHVLQSGHVLETGPFASDGAILATALALGGPGRVPLDRWLAPMSFVVTILVVLACAVLHLARARQIARPSEPEAATE